jgi:Na/Pi-cotransporter
LKKLFFFAGLLGCLALAGCRENDQLKPDKVTVFKGGNQCALPGAPYAEPLFILLTGKPESGLFSSPSAPPPSAEARVRFEAAAGSELIVEPREAVSDAGGLIKVNVAAGRKTGDQYLKVIPLEAPEKAISVRFISGVQIIGADQEGRAGDFLPEPLAVKLVRPDGTPAAGVPIFFQMAGGRDAGGGSFSRAAVVTDAEGKAETVVKLGKATGTSTVNIEIAGCAESDGLRGIAVRELGVDFYALVINVFGGLAIFVFGMKLMSDGLNKAAGERMRSILHFFSSNRYVAIVAGVLVTATIQSSSATTVMVIGFVNAGLLNLMQSIGIIFGANIGTTITAQIIAFDVSSVAMPAIIIGLLLIFVSHRYFNGWGETILGFGFLFFGMTLMGDELKLISKFPSFVAFFRSFDCAPVNGWMPPGALLGAVGIGLLVTMVIQSSSAATGIILALGASGLINLYTAVALVLGTNIGTTITAQLAAIATNRIAKQAAMAHTIFNVTGVLLIGGSFYIRWSGTEIPVFFHLINQITGGDVFGAVPQNVPRHIANAHTVFNVITTVLLIPFIASMAKLCEWMIPVKKEAVKFTSLEPHLLDTPSIALEQVIRSLRGMVAESCSMVKTATEYFLKAEVNNEKFARLDKRENEIDRQQAEITDYLVKITRRELSEPQSEIVPLLMHCTNDAERIADHTENITQLTRRLHDAEGGISPSGKQELTQLFGKLETLAKCVTEGLSEHDAISVKQALKLEQEINQLANGLESNHIERLRRGECNATIGVIFIELVGELEKVGDHLTNIAERTIAIQQHTQQINGESA